MTPDYVADVESRLKELGDCPCGCGLYGTVKKAEHKDGTRHVRGCKCKRCAGRNYKKTASNRERRIARRTGGTRSVLSGALSGYDIGVPLRGGSHAYIEETIAANICRGINAWWNGKTVQKKVARLMSQPGIRILRTRDFSVIPNEDLEALLLLAGEDTA